MINRIADAIDELEDINHILQSSYNIQDVENMIHDQGKDDYQDALDKCDIQINQAVSALSDLILLMQGETL